MTAKLDDATREQLAETARRVELALNGVCPDGVGYCVAIFDFAAKGNVAFMSTAERPQTLTLLRQLVKQVEAGRHHEIDPATIAGEVIPRKGPIG